MPIYLLIQKVKCISINLIHCFYTESILHIKIFRGFKLGLGLIILKHQARMIKIVWCYETHSLVHCIL